jgi:hypothetical protein
VRDVGFFLFAASWIVVVFANSGVIITDSLLIILGADMRSRSGQSRVSALYLILSARYDDLAMATCSDS